MSMSEKGPGRGRGKFTAPGVQADQENRIAALEDYLSDLVDDGTLPAPEQSEPKPSEGESGGGSG